MEKVVEKTIEVPVEKIVEKIVEVPVDRIIEKIVEKPVDRVVEKIVEVPIEVPTIIEVPVYRDRIVEKIVEKPVENTAALKELSDEVARLLSELEKVKSEQESPIIIDPVLPPIVPPTNIQNAIKAQSDFSIESVGTTSFGTSWPANPARGDLFLKVDTKPNRLYKWNGRKWIEIDRRRVDDTLVYDAEYIDYVIQQIRKGLRDYEDLTDAEKQQIVARVRENGTQE